MGMNMLTPREAINLYLKSGENKWDLTNDVKRQELCTSKVRDRQEL